MPDRCKPKPSPTKPHGQNTMQGVHAFNLYPPQSGHTSESICSHEVKKRLYKDGSRKPHKYFYSIRATGIHEGLFSQTIKLSVGRWAIKM